MTAPYMGEHRKENKMDTKDLRIEKKKCEDEITAKVSEMLEDFKKRTGVIIIGVYITMNYDKFDHNRAVDYTNISLDI